MDEKYGSEVRQRRLALDLTQVQLARAIGRSQAWVAQLENLQLPASETNKRRIEAFLRERERRVMRELRAVRRAMPRRAERVAP